MITPKLEQLIWEGKANFKMFNLGGSGVGTIPLDPSTFAVITDIYCYGFDNFGEDLEEKDKLLVHTLHLESKTGRDSITFRSNGGFYDLGGAPGENIQIHDGFFHFQTYFVHQEQIRVDIASIQNPEIWVQVTAATDILANNKPAPLQYDNSVNTIQQIDLQGAGIQEYVPIGRRTKGAALPPDYREQFTADIRTATRIKGANQTEREQVYSYPLVNVAYIVIKGELSEHLGGSK